MNGAPGEGEEAFDRGREIETSAMAALHSAARAAGTGHRNFFASLAAFLEALEHSEEGGDEQYRQTGRVDDATQHQAPRGEAGAPERGPYCSALFHARI